MRGTCEVNGRYMRVPYRILAAVEPSSRREHARGGVAWGKPSPNRGSAASIHLNPTNLEVSYEQTWLIVAETQQFSLWAGKGCRVRAPGLQQHGFVEGVGRVPSPGGH
jgi:hypothetical protein